MTALPYDDGAFDLVCRSDTPENMERPAEALRECRRVLRPGGVLAWPIPTSVDRAAGTWLDVMRAGFDECTMVSLARPAANALYATATQGERTDTHANASADVVLPDVPFRLVVLHYHLMKNAGTTIESILEREFGSAFARVHRASHVGAVSRRTSKPAVVHRLDESLALAEYFLDAAFPGLQLHFVARNVTRPTGEALDARVAELRERCGPEPFDRLERANAFDLRLLAAAEDEIDRRIAAVPDFPARLAAFRERCRALADGGR